MSGPGLAALMTIAPRLADPAHAAALVADWQAAHAGRSALAGLIGRPEVRALLEALADHSPYLWRLATMQPDRLEAMLGASPLDMLDASLAEMEARVLASDGMTEAMHHLRIGKARMALLVALADLGGVWDFEAVVGALTKFADAAVSSALKVLLRDAARTGKLRDAPAVDGAGCGITILALGKGGGGELNYSSDIDLVVLYDGSAPGLAAGVEPAPFYVRMTQALVRLLSERTPDGYVLRVDLRLRPDPASTAVAISLPAAFSYYEAFGQNWERAAFIKARPIAGDADLGRRFLGELSRFIWRKYFDYAAIADIHAMKRQIHAVRGHAEVVVPGHDVKLGRGGIREIEFFVQTQQLIFGGRRPRLRGARTLDMLVELQADGWVSAEAAEQLSEAYRFLRRIEHRLQMIGDEQTQRLPQDQAMLAAFSAWAGYADYDAFAAAITHHMRAVERHYARLFENAPALDIEAGPLVFSGPSMDPETVETLAGLGFQRAAEAVETIRGWHFGRRPAVRSNRAREVLTESLPALLLAFAGSGDPDRALSAFDRLLARLPAAIELFSMLRSNAALRELFADILGLAPRLAATVARRPHLLDGAIDPAVMQGVGVDGGDRLAASLATEDFLDQARDLAQEQMFLIGVRLLAGTDAPERAGEAYSDLAATIVSATLAQCGAEFARTHGRIDGASCVVVALGRLGSREMTATSDLDLLLIYDFDPERPESDGPRPLEATRYYTRLTQRLIANLTVTTRRGRLYDVDMRLRPSGNQGPLATRLRSFIEYQASGADLWEHMALTRARVIAGDPELGRRVASAIETTLMQPRTDAIRRPIADLRALVALEKGEAHPWDFKLMSGGLLDIDFLAQYLALRTAATHPEVLMASSPKVLAAARRAGLIGTEMADVLTDAYRLYANMLQITRLTVEGPFDPAVAGAGLIRRLVAAADVPDFATLERDLRERRAAVRRAFEDVFGPLAA